MDAVSLWYNKYTFCWKNKESFCRGLLTFLRTAAFLLIADNSYFWTWALSSCLLIVQLQEFFLIKFSFLPSKLYARCSRPDCWPLHISCEQKGPTFSFTGPVNCISVAYHLYVGHRLVDDFSLAWLNFCLCQFQAILSNSSYNTCKSTAQIGEERANSLLHCSKVFSHWTSSALDLLYLLKLFSRETKLMIRNIPGVALMKK